MFGDVAAGAKPDSIVFLCVLQELDQSDPLGRPPNEAIIRLIAIRRCQSKFSAVSGCVSLDA
jgi:hypothetical protein